MDRVSDSPQARRGRRNNFLEELDVDERLRRGTVNRPKQDIESVARGPLTDARIRNTTQKHHRSYKCPSCTGEFDKWDRSDAFQKKSCPFCGLLRGEYDPDEE